MKNIKSNYFFNLTYQILAIALPIITTPYVSRILSPDGVGAYNYSFSIASFFVLVASLGSSAYSQREIAFCRDDVKRRSEVFFEILILRIIMFFLISPIYFFFSFSQIKYRALLYIQYILLVSSALDISWLFQGVEDFKSTACRSIVVRIITVFVVFIFVKSENDLGLYTLIMALSTLLSESALWLYVKKNIYIIDFKKINPFRHIKEILLLFLPVAAINIYTSVDKIVLGILSTDAQVGYYSQSEKIVKLAMTVITSLGTVMLPTISVLISQKKWEQVKLNVKESIHFVLYLGIPMMLGMIAIAPIFIPWFLGSEYHESVKLMQMLAPLIIIIGLSSVTGQAVLIPMNLQKIYTFSIFSGALLNILCNFLLIPRYNSVGAVIGTLAAEIIVGLIQQTVVLKELHLKVREIILDARKNIIAGAIMFIIVNGLAGIVLEDAVGVMILVIVGAAVYLVALLVFKDSFTLRYVSKLKSIKRNN